MADYYGAHYKDVGQDGQEYEIWLDSHQWLIDKFLWARRAYATATSMIILTTPILSVGLVWGMRLILED